MFVRFSILATLLVAVVAFSGCCCGPYGSMAQCNGCNDGFNNVRHRPTGPLDALMTWRKELVCGSGCGEAYYGEWVSTPPDACDPCCGDQFVGGATPCQPFCWQPGTIFGNLHRLYGSRVCEFCGNAFTDCGCGDQGYLEGNCGCGSGCDTGCHKGGQSVGHGHPTSGGCSTCSSKSGSANTRIANKTNVRHRNHQSMTQQRYQEKREMSVQR